jgi:DNA-binding response OmpR family regulator
LAGIYTKVQLRRIADLLYAPHAMPITEPVIALLDDEPEMRKAIRRLLTCWGFQVEEYVCGEALLAALDSHPLELLLLDLQMPGINGFEVLEVLRSRSNSVPVIIVTAHDEPGTRERLQALGAYTFIKKPFDQDVLLHAIVTAMSSGRNP